MAKKQNRHQKKRRTPLLLWPFIGIWKLLALVIRLTGRTLAIVIGFVLMVAGIALTVTLIGAIVGIPLIIVGFLLMVRGIFG